MKKKYQFTAITVSIAILFWFSDSLVHYYVYGEQVFELYPSDLNELWMRLAIVVLIVAFGVFIDYRTRLDNVAVYQAMLSATNHILRNYLQRMIIFREEAENSKDFNQDVLKLYDQMIDETLTQIRNLENIQEPNKTSIEERYLPK